MNGVAAIEKSRLVEQGRGKRLRQFHGSRPGWVEHRRSHGWIGAIAPQRRIVALGDLIMKVMAHQLQLVIDLVIDADYVLSNVRGLRYGRDVLAGSKVWLWERARVQLADCILIDQVSRYRVVRKRLSCSQTISRVQCQLGWIARHWNDGSRSVGWHRVCQRLPSCRKITCRDRIDGCGRASLNQSAPLFIYKKEGLIPRIVI